MKTHSLKCWPEYFNALVCSQKKFELRRDDRNFQVGDHIILQEYNPVTGKYTGNECRFEITYILRDAHAFGLFNGFCILSLK